jgi:NodT family efflux transporter outer membrane factor (OMF) lipoprotein
MHFPPRPFSAALFALLLAGCSMVPEYERPATPTPKAWPAEAVVRASAEPVTAEWWRRFGSSELDGLIAEAMAANQDLAAAMARIDQARANARVAGAPLLPTLDGSGSVNRSYDDLERSRDSSNRYNGLLTANYELDLWGKNAAGLQSAEAAVTSSVFDKDTVLLVLQTDVATTYFQILALQDRMKIARDNLAAAQELLRLISVQFEQGAASALDVARQRNTVASFEAQIPQLEQSVVAAQTSLAILLGRAPGGRIASANTLGSLKLPAIAPGQPSTLLERRPDIGRAEADLLSADADIGAARAAFYPSITLSISTGIEGVASGGASALASLVAGLVQPIFTAGRLEGELEGTKARRVELAANYRQTVLTAFKETIDALSGVNTSEAREALLRTAAESAEEAYRLADLNYRSGATDFLTVLDAQRTLLSSQDSLVQATLDRYTTAANLYKALGGGWSLPQIASAKAP